MTLKGGVLTTDEKYKKFMREFLGIEVDGSETIADIELIAGQINTLQDAKEILNEQTSRN